MIISHKHRFIFIKTFKTAGTSIEVFLSQRCGEEDVFTPIFPHVPPHKARNYEEKGFFNHMPALKVRERVGEETWNSYFKFCVERNPWDKTLSHYYMLKAWGEVDSLDEYMERRKFPQSIYMYVDEDGDIIVDDIARYECLSSDLSRIFERVGVPFDGDLGVRAKSEYRKDRRHYRDVLSARQVRIIAEEFAEEIALHGYEF